MFKSNAVVNRRGRAAAGEGGGPGHPRGSSTGDEGQSADRGDERSRARQAVSCRSCWSLTGTGAVSEAAPERWRSRCYRRGFLIIYRRHPSSLAPFGHAARGDDASGLFGESEGCFEVAGFAEGVEFAVAVAVVVVAVGDDVSVVGVVDAAVAGAGEFEAQEVERLGGLLEGLVELRGGGGDVFVELGDLLVCVERVESVGELGGEARECVVAVLELLDAGDPGLQQLGLRPRLLGVDADLVLHGQPACEPLVVDACEETAGAGQCAVGGEQGGAELDQRPLQRGGDPRQPLPHLPGGVCERRLPGGASWQPGRESAALSALGAERRELRAQPRDQQLESRSGAGSPASA